jgi:hypothetical protein
MSEVGAEPGAVAEAALDATVRGQFVVAVPPSSRDERLAAGLALAPELPVSTTLSGGPS